MPAEPSWWYRDPGVAARALSPVASVYGNVAGRRMLRAPDLTAQLPVICIGNFTAGGAGKTPATAFVVRRLLAAGRKPAVLARGYGGRERGPRWVDPATDGADLVGDEPLLHAQLVPAVVARDRAAGARMIQESGLADVIVMDDGLQNPALAKTLSIAIVDGARGFGNGLVIPSGPLRAPLGLQVKKVDAVLFNGSVADETVRMLRNLRPEMPLMSGALVPAESCAGMSGLRAIAFAGIGYPDRFFETARSVGLEVVACVPFPDHHDYTTADAYGLLALAKRFGAILVTTEKDHVRMRRHRTAKAAVATLYEKSRTIPVELQLDSVSAATLERLLDPVFLRAEDLSRD